MRGSVFYPELGLWGGGDYNILSSLYIHRFRDTLSYKMTPLTFFKLTKLGVKKQFKQLSFSCLYILMDYNVVVRAFYHLTVHHQRGNLRSAQFCQAIDNHLPHSFWKRGEALPFSLKSGGAIAPPAPPSVPPLG